MIQLVQLPDQRANPQRPLCSGSRVGGLEADLERRDRDLEGLRECLSRLSQASRRISESVVFDVVLQGSLDSACSLTAIPYGVMTLLDHGDGVQDFPSPEMPAQDAEQQPTTPLSSPPTP